MPRYDVSGTSLGQFKVLHDFDNPYPSGRWALRRALELVIYALSRKVPFLRHFCRTVYDEVVGNFWTLYRLDRLLGLDSIFGINDRVAMVFPILKPESLSQRGIRAVRHWHVSRSEVHWQPELDIPSSQWWFDQDYAKGQRRPRKEEWLVFHCDYPYLLPFYIRCLYELRFNNAAANDPKGDPC